MINTVMTIFPWHDLKKHSFKKSANRSQIISLFSCDLQTWAPEARGTQGWLTTGSKSSSVRPFVDNSSVPWKVQHKHTCMFQMFLHSPQQSHIKKEKDKKERGLNLKVCKKTAAHSGTAQLLNSVAQLTSWQAGQTLRLTNNHEY